MHRRTPAPLFIGLAAALLLAGCGSLRPTPTPSEKPYEQTFGPDYPSEPAAGQRTSVDDAMISADGRTLTITLTGGPPYSLEDACSTDYAPWVAAAGTDLDVAVVLVSHREQATMPPNAACPAIGYGYTFHLLLPIPFLGSTIHDLAGRTLWVRPPPGLVEPQALPSGWQLRWSGDEPVAQPPLWVRVYAPADSQVAGSNGGPGQLDLYQAFGAATQIGGGPERRTVQIGGGPGVLLREPATGELLLQWMVGSNGVALVANEADMTLDQLLAIATASVSSTTVKAFVRSFAVMCECRQHPFVGEREPRGGSALMGRTSSAAGHRCQRARVPATAPCPISEGRLAGRVRSTRHPEWCVQRATGEHRGHASDVLSVIELRVTPVAPDT